MEEWISVPGSGKEKMQLEILQNLAAAQKRICNTSDNVKAIERITNFTLSVIERLGKALYLHGDDWVALETENDENQSGEDAEEKDNPIDYI